MTEPRLAQPSHEQQLEAARAEVERAQRRLACYMEAGRTLTSSLDDREALQALVKVVVPELADHCIFHDLTGGEIVEHRVCGRAEPRGADAPPAHRMNWNDTRHPAVRAIRTGESQFLPDLSSAQREAVLNAASAGMFPGGGALCSLMTVPLRSRDQTIGALTLCFGESNRHHAEEDLRLAEDLAGRAAGVIDGARLYQEARRMAGELDRERARREVILRTQQQAEQRSQEARAEVETACRLRDNFLSTLSHELRTPMAALLLWENILRSAKDETMRGRALDAIHESALAQSKLIEDLLDVSRCISGKLRIERSPIAVAPVINGALAVALPLAAAKGIRVEPLGDDGRLGHVMGDPLRLQQIIGNLLSNAVKFTDRGGRIAVRAERNQAGLEIAVSDTGQGIAAESLADIFKPFSQPDGPNAGLGLGLAMVRRLVDMHHGTVRAESAGERRGATFTVTLPHLESGAGVDAKVDATLDTKPDVKISDALTAPRASPARQSRGAGAASYDRARLLKGLRILVVDDEPRVRKAIAVVLGDAGAKVTTSASAQEAFTVLRRGRWDVVVSDIGMPEEDGYSFVRRLRLLPADQGGSVAAVALTAYARAQDKMRASEAGFDLHLTKPVDAGELIRAIGSVAGVSAAVPAKQL